jgi:hypothetical protein
MSSRKAAAVALGLMLLTPLAACDLVSGGSGDSGVEVEDCDAEDWANREDDCGFAKKKTVKPQPPVVKPPVIRQPTVKRR